MATIAKPELALVLDIDEVLVNSLKKHAVWLQEAAQEYGWAVNLTYDQLCQLGGTHAGYGQIPAYQAINRQMRHSAGFNSNFELIPQAMEAVAFLESLVAFYLTTRPAHLTAVTGQDLIQAGFPDRLVIARPDAIPLVDTNQWKLGVLQNAARSLGRKLITIDDSVSLHRTILQAHDSRLETILFHGPITTAQIRAGEKFEALTWPDIVEKLET